MRILVTGASGFLGSSISAALRAHGHHVVALSRSGGFGDAAVKLDIAKAVEVGDWTPHLEGVEAVINCAGVLQDGARESTEGVHVRGIDALFEACERMGARRIVHFSAIGVDRGAASDFSRTKLAGDTALTARPLEWVVLRPSVVLGPGAVGAGALIRGLAALPVLPLMPNTGLLQVVQLDDVVETVRFFLSPGAPSRVVIELAGPERLRFDQVVARYRSWLGWRPARTVRLPEAFSRFLYRIGDLAGLLGWRTALRSNARKEIVRGAIGDPADWKAVTGIDPQTLDAALTARAPSEQERLFARLYFLKPVVFAVFSAFWLGTGLVSLGPGFGMGLQYMERTAVAGFAAEGVIAGALADLAVGAAIAYRPTARAGLYGALAISLFYVTAGTLLLPELWRDPLGPMLKIWPILALNLVALALLDDR